MTNSGRNSEYSCSPAFQHQHTEPTHDKRNPEQRGLRRLTRHGLAIVAPVRRREQPMRINQVPLHQEKDTRSQSTNGSTQHVEKERTTNHLTCDRRCRCGPRDRHRCAPAWPCSDRCGTGGRRRRCNRSSKGISQRTDAKVCAEQGEHE